MKRLTRSKVRVYLHIPFSSTVPMFQMYANILILISGEMKIGNGNKSAGENGIRMKGTTGLVNLLSANNSSQFNVSFTPYAKSIRGKKDTDKIRPPTKYKKADLHTIRNIIRDDDKEDTATKWERKRPPAQVGMSALLGMIWRQQQPGVMRPI